MILSDSLLRTLLGAIETDALALLCGAGLSVPPPSSLLSAAKVAQSCYDQWLPIEALDPALRDDVDGLAGHFYAHDQFERVFLKKLVPWGQLLGVPNSGHAAVADFLVTRTAFAALTTNFDTMIESWASQRKVDLRGALSAREAVEFRSTTNPLLKLHGCLERGREATLWTSRQLSEPQVVAQIADWAAWIRLHLPGKHLLVVGFWTDWGYLNKVLAQAFAVEEAASITVVDPICESELRAKAPELWSRLTSSTRAFQHVPGSGADVLAELRTAQSRVWARRFYALGQPLLPAAAGMPPPPLIESLVPEDLYDLRRDAEGVPYSLAATLKDPAPSTAQAAAAHLMLLAAGATRRGAWFEFNGQVIRVVNGAGRGMATVRQEYVEPATVPQADIVVCAGGIDLGTPGHLLSTGRGASVVRPAPGGAAEWLTLERARQELRI